MKARIGRRVPLALFMRGGRRDDEHNRRGLKAVINVVGHDKVAEVGGVEGAAENDDGTFPIQVG